MRILERIPIYDMVDYQAIYGQPEEKRMSA
jgi:hypothetical protein